jgi:hypothetical protein
MGKQGDMKFIGTVENLIYYKWRDIYVVRTKPTKVKQTKASIEQSKLFGIAAHTGAVLRSILKPALPDAKDPNMMRRLEQVVVSWLRTGAYKSGEPQNSIPFIMGFEFNESSLLNSRLKLPVTVNRTQRNTIVVSIPAMQPTKDITAPAYTKSVTLKLRAAACSLLNDNSLLCTTKELTIDYNNVLVRAQQIELPLAVEAGNVTLVLMVLEYTVIKNDRKYVVKDKRWMPAGIPGAMWN